MAIYKNNRIVIDLSELVEIRSQVINQELSEYDVEQIASALQHTLNLGYSISYGRYCNT